MFRSAKEWLVSIWNATLGWDELIKIKYFKIYLFFFYFLVVLHLFSVTNIYTASIILFKVISGSTRKKCDFYSKLLINTTELRQLLCQLLCQVSLPLKIPHIILVFLFLSLNKCHLGIHNKITLTDSNGILTLPRNSGAPRLSSSKTVISMTSWMS